MSIESFETEFFSSILNNRLTRKNSNLKKETKQVKVLFKIFRAKFKNNKSNFKENDLVASKNESTTSKVKCEANSRQDKTIEDGLTNEFNEKINISEDRSKKSLAAEMNMNFKILDQNTKKTILKKPNYSSLRQLMAPNSKPFYVKRP